MNKSLDRVQEIGIKMGLSQYVINAGKGFYRLAAGKKVDDPGSGLDGYGFVQGRSVTIVATVCLYTACRK